MTGRRYRIALFGLLITCLLTTLSFHTAQGRVDLAGDYAGGGKKVTLPPIENTPTPTPSIIADVLAVQAKASEPVQISSGGCCPYPQWSSDSEFVLYVDSVGEQGAGLYGVPVEGGPPAFLTSRVGSYSQDLSLVAYPEAGLVYVERWAIGDRWLVPSQGREVFLSHENEWIAWEYGSTSIQNQDLKQRTIWIANIKGEAARELVTVHGGRFLGWISHGQAVIVSGRLSPLSPAGIWRVDRETGAAVLLFGTDKPRDVLISPEGEWLVFTVAFQTDRTKNGIWVSKTDGTSMSRLPAYGSYRWRSEGELLLIPYDFESDRPYLWQFSVNSNDIWALTNPADTDLTIANNDWQPSPDGEKIVFYSSEDRNLWVLELPDTAQ